MPSRTLVPNSLGGGFLYPVLAGGLSTEGDLDYLWGETSGDLQPNEGGR